VAEKDHADFALRRAINAGRTAGPRMFTAGRALVCTGGHGHESGDTLECDGPVGFRRGVRSQIKAGADLIKVMISGGIAGEHEGIATPQLFADEMAQAAKDDAQYYGWSTNGESPFEYAVVGHDTDSDPSGLDDAGKSPCCCSQSDWPNDIPVICTTGSKPIGAQKLSPPFDMSNIK